MSLEHKFREMFHSDARSRFLFPGSIEELAELVASHEKLILGGSDGYRVPGPSQEVPRHRILLDELKEILWFSPENQLVAVQAGVSLASLNSFLREQGFEIPIGLNEADQDHCVGDMIALNLPHWRIAESGSWRDWVVRTRVVLASAETVVSGADVVKNVTGFDLHKLLIGARHTLGVIADVTLRVRPVSAPREYPPIRLNHGVLVQSNHIGLKALREHLAEWLNDESLPNYIDEEAGLALVGTLYHRKTREEFDHKRHGHIWRSDIGEFALAEFSELEQRLMKRTKEIFDPGFKLNAGEFGFI